MDSGIGAATAREFSEQGHPLLLFACRRERLGALDLPRTMCADLDVTDLEGLEAAIANAEATHGQMDCLVNHAAMILLDLVKSDELAEWKKMLDMNVVAAIDVTRVLLRSMIDRKRGTVININLTSGGESFPHDSAYRSTKFAVDEVSRSIRKRVRPHNIRFVMITPDSATGDLLGYRSPADIKRNSEYWMGRAISAVDVAHAISFAYNQPQNVCVREIVLTATGQQA